MTHLYLSGRRSQPALGSWMSNFIFTLTLSSVKCYTLCAQDIGEKSVSKRQQELNLCYRLKQILEREQVFKKSQTIYFYPPEVLGHLPSHRRYIFIHLPLGHLFVLGSVSLFSPWQWSSLQYKYRLLKKNHNSQSWKLKSKNNICKIHLRD